MEELLNNKYLINKTFELLKYCFTVGVIGYLIIKAPNETSQLTGTIGAFILGGSKVRSKFGL